MPSTGTTRPLRPNVEKFVSTGRVNLLSAVANKNVKGPLRRVAKRSILRESARAARHSLTFAPSHSLLHGLWPWFVSLSGLFEYLYFVPGGRFFIFKNRQRSFCFFVSFPCCIQQRHAARICARSSRLFPGDFNVSPLYPFEFNAEASVRSTLFLSRAVSRINGLCNVSGSWAR